MDPFLMQVKTKKDSLSYGDPAMDEVLTRFFQDLPAAEPLERAAKIVKDDFDIDEWLHWAWNLAESVEA